MERNDWSDEQQVVRTLGELKKFASYNWWVGFGSGMVALITMLALLTVIGLKTNI